MKLIIILGAAFVCCVGWIKSASKVRSLKQSLAESEKSLAESRKKSDKLESELSDSNKALNLLHAKFEDTLSDYDVVRQGYVAKSNSHQRVCEELAAVKRECQALKSHLFEKERDFNELSSFFNEQLLKNNPFPASQFEAHVYVNAYRPSKFHASIHGQWKDYKLIPLRSAIDKGYSPCLQCFTAMHKEQRQTDTIRFSLNAPVVVEDFEVNDDSLT